MKTVWYTLSGFHGRYEINKLGEVMDLVRGHKLRHRLTHYGYPMVTLYNSDYKKNSGWRGWLIHRLVMIQFVPNPENKPQVNHKNGIKTDNRLENLEWVTKQENHDHARMMNLLPKGSKCPQSILKESDIPIIKYLRHNGAQYKDIATVFGVALETIRDVVKGTRWKHLK